MTMRDIGSHAPRLKAMGSPKALGSRLYGPLSALLGMSIFTRSVFTSRNFGLTEPGRVLTCLIPVGR